MICSGSSRRYKSKWKRRQQPPSHSFPSVKVGECTRPATPSPRAMPLTSSVLPAPNSPVSPMTSPLMASFPQRSPSAWVSSGLFEMSIAMSRQELNPHFAADLKAWPFRHLADASEWQIRKFLSPGIKEWNCIPTSHCEEQFKILAISQCRLQRSFAGLRVSYLQSGNATDRNRIGEYLCADTARLQDVWQGAGQTIAKVDHRVNVKMAGEPARFVQTRFEIQMFSGKRAAKLAGNENRVARFRARTKHTLVFGHGSEQGDRNEDALRIRRRFPANDGHVMQDGQGIHAPRNRLNELRIELLWQRKRDQRSVGSSGHRCNIAQTAGQRFVSDLLRCSGRPIMNSFHHGVGLQQDETIGQAQVQYGAVVTSSNAYRSVRRQRRG